MDKIDYTYIIPAFIALLSFIMVLYLGIDKFKNTRLKYLRYIPILSVLALVIGVFIISKYYQDQSRLEKMKFLELSRPKPTNIYLSIDNSSSKHQKIDSLKSLNIKLKEILDNIKKQEKIIGVTSDIKEQVKEKIISTKIEIGSIESYNEIINQPEFLKSGYTVTGNTAKILFNCPKDTSSEYIDLKFRFLDKNILDSIACVYIVESGWEDGKTWLLFSQAYRPKDGVNAFKIPHIIKPYNITLDIGYFLKSEINKKYPTFNKITCHFNKSN